MTFGPFAPNDMYTCDRDMVAFYVPFVYALLHMLVVDSSFYQQNTEWTQQVTEFTNADEDFTIGEDTDDDVQNPVCAPSPTARPKTPESQDGGARPPSSV